MKELGLKLWSRNVLDGYELVKEISDYARKNNQNYIELFVVPETWESTKDLCFELFSGLPIIIHAAHSSFGLDTGNIELLRSNQIKINEAKKFADLFNSEIIIVHAGEGTGDKYLAETIRQFKSFNDKRITVENLPYSDEGKYFFHGATPKEIALIKQETHCKFCLDFSHAICAANSLKQDIDETLQAFANLNPDMYHICDGNIDSSEDLHLYLGEGNYNLSVIFNKYITQNALITIETGEGFPKNMEPLLKDILYLKNL